MVNFRSMGKVLPCLMLFLSLLPAGLALGADPAGGPARVAILPFNMHTPPNLSYLQDGVREMFASRLGWQGKVQVIEKSATEPALKGIKGDISAVDALRIGKTLKVDYVLYGSVTGLGQSISIDARVVTVSGAGEPTLVLRPGKNAG